MQRTDYSQIAPTYNNRYSVNYLVKLEKELCKLIELNNYKNILEVGCGTGRWISSIEKKRKKNLWIGLFLRYDENSKVG